ncbi:MAG: UbiD family decarboxylase, partial [Candidatus Micrarchaeaceae archaeon]
MEFRDFVSLLDREEKIVHVDSPISRDYEVAKYLKKNDGKPLIFENVTGSKMQMPVVGNALSSMDLICRGLGIPKEKWIEYIDKAIENPKSAESGSP